MIYPAANFSTLTMPVTSFSGNLFRSFSLSRGKTASSVLYFGKAGTERYDSPDKAYGVCYLGKTPGGCFIETFGQSMARAIDRALLEERGIATIAAKDLKVVDITGTGAYQIGARGEVWTGDRALSRVWSKAIFEHPAIVDGILYAGNHNSAEHSIALFDRAQSKVKLISTTDWIDSTDLPGILNDYQIAFFDH